MTGLVVPLLLALLMSVVGGRGSTLWKAAAVSAASSTFTPVADAYVRGDRPNTNYGRQLVLRTDASPVLRSYLRFNLQGLESTVVSARLRVYANSANSLGYKVRSVADNNWSETGITYNSAPPASSTITASSGAIAAGTWTEVDVTSLVAGDGLLSLALASPSATATSLASRESARSPQLIVESVAPAAPTISAYYYPWYGSERRHWQQGYVRAVLSTPQAPLLGEYDSRSQAVIDSHFGWAQQYGVDNFIASWNGPRSYEDVTIRDHLLPSPSIGGTTITIFYESIFRLGLANGRINFDSAAEQRLIDDFDYLARTYFGNPHYYRIDGKPVVYLYVTRIYTGDYARALANLRSTIRAQYGYDLYLVGDEMEPQNTPDADHIRLFDAITGYTMYNVNQAPGWPDDTGYLSAARQLYEEFRTAAANLGVAFIPSVLPGYNDRGVRLAAGHYVLPREVNAATGESYSLFRDFLSLARGYVDPAANALDITSWNEWHEDTEIEPTAPAAASSTPSLYTQGYAHTSHGFRLLEILRAFKDSYRATSP